MTRRGKHPSPYLLLALLGLLGGLLICRVRGSGSRGGLLLEETGRINSPGRNSIVLVRNNRRTYKGKGTGELPKRVKPYTANRRQKYLLIASGFTNPISRWSAFNPLQITEGFWHLCYSFLKSLEVRPEISSWLALPYWMRSNPATSDPAEILCFYWCALILQWRSKTLPLTKREGNFFKYRYTSLF